MKVEQISVFLENKSGRLAELTGVLGEAGINIRALSIADTSDFGILRLIVNKPEDALKVLKEAGFTVSITEIIAVEVEDRPGVLAQIAGAFGTAGVSLASVIQKGRGMQPVTLVFVTHEVREAQMLNALKAIEKLPCVNRINNLIRVETQ